jgi:hypothetical protein
MTAAGVCLKCGAPLERPDVGRPPAYCSPACRRAAEFELRRLQRRIERLEEYASNLRLQGGGERRQLQRVQQELDRAEGRLRELLAGHPEPDRVSPP